MKLTASTLLFFSVLALAQDKAPAPAFEVASIKPNAANDGRAMLRMGQGGEVITSNFTLAGLVQFAYDVKGYSLNCPDWMNGVSFDVNAKPPAGTARDQIKPMLQTLLAERFKLQIHRETKSMTGYALLTAKGGLKIKPVEPNTDVASGGGRRIQMGGGEFEGKQLDLKGFATFLSGQVGGPVVDMTAIPGLFDITLHYTPEDHGGGANPEGPPASSEAGPSVFTALQEQLGLHLVSQKVPVEIVVVDKIEKVPTEN